MKSDADLARARDHINYERMILKSSLDGMARHALEPLTVFALLESFTVHARNLDYFLFTRDSERKFATDMVAENFVEDVAKWEAARGTRAMALAPLTRTNKEVAHLTYDRLTVSPGSKGWTPEPIARELLRLMDLFEQHVKPSVVALPVPKSLGNVDALRVATGTSHANVGGRK